MDSPHIEDSLLTERQAEVIELREEGLTQQAVAERLGTTASNVSAVERAATDNIEKARRTLSHARLLRAPVRFSFERGVGFDEVVERVYAAGDEAGINIDYCRPELYSHLYTHLAESFDNSKLVRPVEIGVTQDGDVNVYSAA
ncbi:MAG TPA: Tfx family DNA-binding protein [Halococcus sp.]|nr:Tfx family DNA-binding protein [Halococcus sp.]